MNFDEPSIIKCIKAVATRVWGDEFSYIIIAEDEARLFAAVNRLLPAEKAKHFKAERFRRVVVFEAGEPFKE